VYLAWRRGGKGRKIPCRLRGTQKAWEVFILLPPGNTGDHLVQRKWKPSIVPPNLGRFSGAQERPKRDPECAELKARCRSQVPAVAYATETQLDHTQWKQGKEAQS